VCGDDPNPDINKDDVSKDKGHALSDGVTPSDGQQALEGHLAGKKPRLLEEFGTRTFEDVWHEVEGIKENVAPTSVDEAWRSIGNQLHTSAVNFETEVKKLKAGGGWEGKTIEAAYTNAINSISEPFYTGTAALRGAELTHKFRDVMNYVHKNLVNDPLGKFPTMWDRYQDDLNWNYQQVPAGRGGVGGGTRKEATSAGEKEGIRQYYNEYMRVVMNDSYKPGINDIYSGYPQYAENTQPAQPINIPGLPEKPGKPAHTPVGVPSAGNGGGTSPYGGGGLNKSNLGGGKPSIPKPPSLEDLKNQTKLPTDIDKPGQTDKPGQNDPNRPSVTDPSKALDNGLTSGLTNAATQAMGGATQAASQAAQAAKASPNGLSKGLGNKPKLPEGALQLGKGGAGPGAGGARGGGGASLGGAAPRLSSLPAAASQTEAAGLSKAGMGAASPGMGAPGTPGGGHGGGAGQQQGKEHKVIKALRSRKTGTEIAGEAEAVVPVIGQDQGPDQDQDQQDEVAAQRGPDRSRGPSAASPPMPVSPAGPDRRQVGGRG
jgi:hypothetical protein